MIKKFGIEFPQTSKEWFPVVLVPLIILLTWLYASMSTNPTATWLAGIPAATVPLTLDDRYKRGVRFIFFVILNLLSLGFSALFVLTETVGALWEDFPIDYPLETWYLPMAASLYALLVHLLRSLMVEPAST